MLSCETKLLVVDELHFLKQRTTSVQISNQFKYISNEFPLTIIGIGIGLRQRGLYSDGVYADGILGQSGRRTTPLHLREFAAHRRLDVAVVKPIARRPFSVQPVVPVRSSSQPRMTRKDNPKFPIWQWF